MPMQSVTWALTGAGCRRGPHLHRSAVACYTAAVRRLLLALPLLGCGLIPPLEDECAQDSDCDAGLCVAGVCVPDAPAPDAAHADLLHPPDATPDGPPTDAARDAHTPDGPIIDASISDVLITDVLITDGPVADGTPADVPRLDVSPADAADVAIPFDAALEPDAEGGCHFGDQRPCEGPVEGCGGFLESCTQADVWGPCRPRDPAFEVCNAIDDDCNGVVDDLVAFDDSLDLAAGRVRASQLALALHPGEAIVAWGQRAQPTGVAARVLATDALAPGPNLLPVNTTPDGVAIAALANDDTPAVLVFSREHVIRARRLNPQGGGIGRRLVLARGTAPTAAGPAVAWIQEGRVCATRLRMDGDQLAAAPTECPFQGTAAPVLAEGEGTGLAWVDGDRVLFARRAADGWSPVTQLSSPAEVARAPALAPHAQGFAAGWLGPAGPVLARVGIDGAVQRWSIPREAEIHGLAVAAHGQHVVGVWAERARAAQRLHAAVTTRAAPRVQPVRMASRWARRPLLKALPDGFVLAWMEETELGPVPWIGAGGLVCP